MSKEKHAKRLPTKEEILAALNARKDELEAEELEAREQIDQLIGAITYIEEVDL